MTDELMTAYAQAVRPYIDPPGLIPEPFFKLKSWTYFIEINSTCNLHCILCSSGNRQGYEHINGYMSLELLEKILDKIKMENPEARVLPYGNSEPFLHPELPECISAIKRHGFKCEIATNLNVVNRLDEVLAANPDYLIISVSGFTQEVYGKTHRGGNIETVKNNMRLLAEARLKCEHKVHVIVNYHKYIDNLGSELDQMKSFAEQCGFGFLDSPARSISMENTIQYLRLIQKTQTGHVPPIRIGKDGKDWNSLLPPVTKYFVENIERLLLSPKEASQSYSIIPIPEVCPVGDVFTFIRHDGLVSLCACLSDRRLTIGNYLEMTQDQMSETRRGHPICRECLRYRMNLYFHAIDYTHS